MNPCKGQISAELMVTISAMIVILLVMVIVDGTLNNSWELQKETLQTSSAANQMSLAINRAVAGGNGTEVAFNNFAGTLVQNMTISEPRAVKATSKNGVWSTTPIATNRTNVSGTIPINQDVTVRNTNGVISIEAG